MKKKPGEMRDTSLKEKETLFNMGVALDNFYDSQIDLYESSGLEAGTFLDLMLNSYVIHLCSILKSQSTDDEDFLEKVRLFLACFLNRAQMFRED